MSINDIFKSYETYSISQTEIHTSKQASPSLSLSLASFLFPPPQCAFPLLCFAGHNRHGLSHLLALFTPRSEERLPRVKCQGPLSSQTVYFVKPALQPHCFLLSHPLSHPTRAMTDIIHPPKTG